MWGNILTHIGMHHTKSVLGTKPSSPHSSPMKPLSMANLVRQVTPLTQIPATNLLPVTCLGPSLPTWADQVRIPIATE